eukprot:2800906-Rhodomonas_salina.1
MKRGKLWLQVRASEGRLTVDWLQLLTFTYDHDKKPPMRDEKPVGNVSLAGASTQERDQDVDARSVPQCSRGVWTKQSHTLVSPALVLVFSCALERLIYSWLVISTPVRALNYSRMGAPPQARFSSFCRVQTTSRQPNNLTAALF